MSLLRAASLSSSSGKQHHPRILLRSFATNSKVTTTSRAAGGGAHFRVESNRLHNTLEARTGGSSIIGSSRARNSSFTDYRCCFSTARSVAGPSSPSSSSHTTPQSQVEAASSAMQVDSVNGAAKLIDGNAIAKCVPCSPLTNFCVLCV